MKLKNVIIIGVFVILIVLGFGYKVPFIADMNNPVADFICGKEDTIGRFNFVKGIVYGATGDAAKEVEKQGKEKLEKANQANQELLDKRDKQISNLNEEVARSNNEVSKYDYFYIELSDAGMDLLTMGYIKANKFSTVPTLSQMKNQKLTWTNPDTNSLFGQNGTRWRKIGTISKNDLSKNQLKSMGK